MSNLAITLDTRELDKWALKFEQVSRDIPNAVSKAVHLTSDEGKTYITPRTPKITGTLRRGFQVQKLGRMLWRIYNLVEYMLFIETGERSDPRSGRRVRRRKGPARMMAGSIRQISERLDRNVSRALDALLRRIK